MTPASASPLLADERARETAARRPHADGMLNFHAQSCKMCQSGTPCVWAIELERVASGVDTPSALRQGMEARHAAKSAYVLPCPCGVEVRSHEPKAVCAGCGRELRVESWGKKL